MCWAAVAATCLAASPAHAGYRHLLRGEGEPVRHPIDSSSKNLISTNGAVFFFAANPTGFEQTSVTRETSEQEHIIATLRRWENYQANWDHEGAKAPNIGSVRSASAFICSLDRDATMPEPMLHDSGRAGLFWESDQLYADLEFLDEGSIAYYIERGSDRHKGVVAFDKQHIPAFLEPLLKA